MTKNIISFHKKDTIIFKKLSTEMTHYFQLFTELSTISTICV